MTDYTKLFETELCKKYKNVVIEIYCYDGMTYNVNFYLKNFELKILIDYKYDNSRDFIDNFKLLSNKLYDTIKDTVMKQILQDIRN